MITSSLGFNFVYNNINIQIRRRRRNAWLCVVVCHVVKTREELFPLAVGVWLGSNVHISEVLSYVGVT